MKYFLAVDIGASSGRHMLAHMEEDRMVLEEVHRFYNGMTEKNGHKIWDVDTLFEEIKIGMKKCASLGKIPESMGIDTWAVDFVLLDKNGGRIGDAVAYRDARTTGMDEGMPDCRREAYCKESLPKGRENRAHLCFVQQVRNNLISKIILHRIPFILIFISL